jgi:hypothetical protein
VKKGTKYLDEANEWIKQNGWANVTFEHLLKMGQFLFDVDLEKVKWEGGKR